jgi:hypothetical protein
MAEADAELFSPTSVATPDEDPDSPYAAGLPGTPPTDPAAVHSLSPNQRYIDAKMHDENPWRDPAPDPTRPLVTVPTGRGGVPLIATTQYPGRLVDARTVILSPTNTIERVGYRGASPDPGSSLMLYQYADGNTTAVVELLSESGESSTMLGFVLPNQATAGVGVPITLPISRAVLRLANVGTAAFVRVGVLVIANDRET